MEKTSLVVKQRRPQKFKVRNYTRCNRCGRPRSGFEKFGLCRICLRELAHQGAIPGMANASWEPMLTDPIADMLARIRNANKALHEHVTMPTSKMKVEIARLLKEEGYIRDYRVEKGESFDTLVVDLKFGRNRERVISGLKRVSKPGRRVYARKDRLPRVLGGMGVAILSTSSGLVTGRTAQERGIGGEVVAFIW